MDDEADVVVVGAGMVGAACAYYCGALGLRVVVVDRGAVGGGTTSACEGNLLLSDKVPGPEMEISMLSARLWRELAEEFGVDAFEFHVKGGVVVATSAGALRGLRTLATEQRGVGVDAVDVSAGELADYEPNLTKDVAGGVFYPQDSQVQPMLAAAQLLRRVRERGGVVLPGTEVTGVVRDRERVVGVRVGAGVINAGWVVNAAGTWSGHVASLAGASLPILPRRGFVLVTEPLPLVVRHKVYTADYVANVFSSDAGLEASAVVEGTRAGTVLIGASRERVGFDRTISLPVLRRLAAQAVRLFPFLGGVKVLRSYLGFRPYSPDHLPVIGCDPLVPGLIHASGHEGGGIGLAPATGHLVASVIAGKEPELDPTPFLPERFS